MTEAGLVDAPCLRALAVNRLMGSDILASAYQRIEILYVCTLSDVMHFTSLGVVEQWRYGTNWRLQIVYEWIKRNRLNKLI
jgi:hypothetical protein